MFLFSNTSDPGLAGSPSRGSPKILTVGQPHRALERRAIRTRHYYRELFRTAGQGSREIFDACRWSSPYLPIWSSRAQLPTEKSFDLCDSSWETQPFAVRAYIGQCADPPNPLGAACTHEASPQSTASTTSTMGSRISGDNGALDRP